MSYKKEPDTSQGWRGFALFPCRSRPCWALQHAHQGDNVRINMLTCSCYRYSGIDPRCKSLTLVRCGWPSSSMPAGTRTRCLRRWRTPRRGSRASPGWCVCNTCTGVYRPALCMKHIGHGPHLVRGHDIFRHCDASASRLSTRFHT